MVLRSSARFETLINLGVLAAWRLGVLAFSGIAINWWGRLGDRGGNGFGEVDVTAELAHIEVVVEAVLLEQFFVRAALDDLAVFEDEELISVADGAEAVGYDERGAAPEKLFESGLDEALGAGVDRRGGL